MARSGGPAGVSDGGRSKGRPIEGPPPSVYSDRLWLSTRISGAPHGHNNAGFR